MVYHTANIAVSVGLPTSLKLKQNSGKSYIRKGINKNIYRKMEGNTVEMKPLVGKKKIERKLAIEKNTPSAGQNAPSAEQLTQLVDQLYSRNQQLAEALNEKNTALMFKRLDYLFKVIESSHMFSDEFVDKCIDELQRTLDITQEEEDKEETEVNEDGEQD